MVQKIDQTRLVWKKATKSGAGNCLEVAKLANGNIAVRDSKQSGQGPVLQYTLLEWDAFLNGAKNGEFDTLAK